MEAAEYKRVDTDYRVHQLAYLNFAARATKRRGKSEVPVYDKFSKFYNYPKELDKVKNKGKTSSMLSRLSKHMKKGG